MREIRKRGYLRSGLGNALPFAFENQAGRLVGFDVEMAYRLAVDMKVALEFVPIDREQVAAMLNGGYVDMIMSGVAVTLERAQDVVFSAPYMDQTLAFIVKDYRHKDINSNENLKSLKM